MATATACVQCKEHVGYMLSFGHQPSGQPLGKSAPVQCCFRGFPIGAQDFGNRLFESTELYSGQLVTPPLLLPPPYFGTFWLRCEKPCLLCVLVSPGLHMTMCLGMCCCALVCVFAVDASKSNKCCSWGQCPQQCCAWGQCCQQCCSWGQCSRPSLPTGALAIYQEACQ